MPIPLTRIRDARIPYRVPDQADLTGRLRAVHGGERRVVEPGFRVSGCGVDGLDLDGTTCSHAIRADLLRRLGRNIDAALAYEEAIARTRNTAERDLLRRRREALTRA